MRLRAQHVASPKETSISLGDLQVIDRGFAATHEAIGREFPLLVSIAAIPLACDTALILEPRRNAVVGERPEVFDEAILLLARPFFGEQRDDLAAPSDETIAVPPFTVDRISAMDRPALYRSYKRSGVKKDLEAVSLRIGDEYRIPVALSIHIDSVLFEILLPSIDLGAGIQHETEVRRHFRERGSLFAGDEPSIPIGERAFDHEVEMKAVPGCKSFRITRGYADMIEREGTRFDDGRLLSRTMVNRCGRT